MGRAAAVAQGLRALAPHAECCELESKFAKTGRDSSTADWEIGNCAKFGKIPLSQESCSWLNSTKYKHTHIYICIQLRECFERKKTHYLVAFYTCTGTKKHYLHTIILQKSCSFNCCNVMRYISQAINDRKICELTELSPHTSEQEK